MHLNGDGVVPFKIIAGTPAYLKQAKQELQLPESFALKGNYPNPFNPVTTVRFSIPFQMNPADVSVAIYNLRGRHVQTLFKGSSPGTYSIQWNASDNANSPVASGMYILRMKAIDGDAVLFRQQRRMMFVK